jgi:hypothetical protein
MIATRALVALPAWLSLLWVAEAAPKGRYKAKRGGDAPSLMSKADTVCAYRLMEATCPFPSQGMSRAAPHAWECAAALGRATSLSTSCVFTHMLIVLSLVLNAIQSKYGGILGKFPNLLMIQHGAPGEGKSVALWLVFQILYYFDSLRTKLRLDAWKADMSTWRGKVKAWEQQAEALPEERPEQPPKPEPSDSVLNKGTFIGMGAMFEKQECRGYLGLHETNNFLADAFDNKPGGGMEDLNQIQDHDIYKNTPASGTRFYVRNPHLVGSLLMHLEEFVRQAKQEDSIAGLSRFLVAHFPCVVHKIMPEGSSQEIEKALAEDPDYFNSLTYDNVVKAMTNVLLLADKLFPMGSRRADEIGQADGNFSDVRGIHQQAWAPNAKAIFTKEFNEQVDNIREDRKDGGENADMLNKDKTRFLQFISPLDVYEKVTVVLLKTAGVSTEAAKNMSGEDMIDRIASVDITTTLAQFEPKEVCPLATQDAIDGAITIASWFKKMYDLSTNADGAVAAFKLRRSNMIQVLPPATLESALEVLGKAKRHEVNPYETLLKLLDKRDHFKRYAMDPYNTDAEVHTRVFEILVLVFMGFLAIADGRWGCIRYAEDDQNFLHAAHRLGEWCNDVDMATLRSQVPREQGAMCALDRDKADCVCKSLKAVLDGRGIAPEEIPSPFREGAPAAQIPLTQPPGAGESRHARSDLTQSGGDDPEQPPAKKLRGEEPLTRLMFSQNLNVVFAATKHHLAKESAPQFEQWRLNAYLKPKVPGDEGVDLARNLVRFWRELGLAEDAGKVPGTKTQLLAPPENMRVPALQKLGEMMHCTAEELNPILKAWSTRAVCAKFALNKLDELKHLVSTAEAAEVVPAGQGGGHEDAVVAVPEMLAEVGQEQDADAVTEQQGAMPYVRLPAEVPAA